MPRRTLCLTDSHTRVQVLLGGGQDASQVTTTAAKAGGFEARFFHKVSTSSSAHTCTHTHTTYQHTHTCIHTRHGGIYPPQGQQQPMHTYI